MQRRNSRSAAAPVLNSLRSTKRTALSLASVCVEHHLTTRVNNRTRTTPQPTATRTMLGRERAGFDVEFKLPGDTVRVVYRRCLLNAERKLYNDAAHSLVVLQAISSSLSATCSHSNCSGFGSGSCPIRFSKISRWAFTHDLLFSSTCTKSARPYKMYVVGRPCTSIARLSEGTNVAPADILVIVLEVVLTKNIHQHPFHCLQRCVSFLLGHWAEERHHDTMKTTELCMFHLSFQKWIEPVECFHLLFSCAFCFFIRSLGIKFATLLVGSFDIHFDHHLVSRPIQCMPHVRGCPIAQSADQIIVRTVISAIDWFLILRTSWVVIRFVTSTRNLGSYNDRQSAPGVVVPLSGKAEHLGEKIF